MSGDYSRNTTYADTLLKDKKVRFYQGRSITDAQLNANTDLLEAQREKALVDLFGEAAVPDTNPGFGLRARRDSLTLMAGHMYIDGVLFENDNHLTYTPDLSENVPHVAYFVGEKTEYNYLTREFIRDPALGGPDTAGRSRCGGKLVVSPLKDVLDYASIPSESDFKNKVRNGIHIPLPQCGLHDAAAKFSINMENASEDNNCLINENARYKGQDNINYHVEIHSPTSSGAPTLKWARQFVQARLEQNLDGDFILVGNVSDALMSFKDQGVVEVSDAHMVTTNQPGILAKLTDNQDGTYSLPPAVTAEFATMVPPVMIRRWDHNLDPETHPNGVPIGKDPIGLENGVQIELKGDIVTGDQWQCAARVVTGDILWPPTPVEDGFVAPFNWRRCAVLGIVQKIEGQITVLEDLRNRFPNLTRIDARDIRFSSNACNFGSDTPTVHDALLKICSRIDKDGCTIRVRPDKIEDPSDVPYLGVEHFPTLEAVVKGLTKFFEETRDLREGDDFRMRDVSPPQEERRADEIEPQPRVGKSLLKPDLSTRLHLTSNEDTLDGDNAIGSSPSPRNRTLIFNPKIVDEIDLFEADTIPNERNRDDNEAIPDEAPQPETNNPFLLYRRLSIEFLPGNYKWPEGFTFLFEKMSGICLKSCCDGNVNLTSTESLIFKECTNVTLCGINLSFTEKGTQLQVIGGERINICNTKVTRHEMDSIPLASLSAQSRIKIRDSEFLLPLVEGYNEYRLGIHIEGSQAHTTFNFVQSNGFVILGEGVPTNDQDPVQFILDKSIGQVLEIDNFAPIMHENQSSKTARVEGCKLFGLIPGGLLLSEVKKWAGSNEPSEVEDIDLSFRELHVQDCELQEGYNIFLAETVILRDNRFFGRSENTCQAGSAILEDGVLKFEDKSPAYRALHHVVLDPATERPRFWSAVGFVIAKHASIHSNFSFDVEARSRTKSLPLILDLSKRSFDFELEYEMEQTVYDMIRLNMLVFHSYYIMQ